jgi:hypothetical protein
MRLPARVALAVLLVAGAGGLAVAEHGARAEDELTALAFARGSVRAGDLARGVRLAGDARRLDPGTRPDEILAVLEIRAGRDRAATQRLLRAARREPENSHLWGLLARSAQQADPAVAANAVRRLARLVPPVPAGG